MNWDLIFEIVAIIIGSSTVAALIVRYAIGSFTKKAGDLLGKIAGGGESGADLLEELGLPKVALPIDEGADVVKEASDVFKAISNAVKEDSPGGKKITKEELENIVKKEGKELIVEFKDFKLKVFPKK